MAQGGSGNKVTNKLVAASCAAVLAVYTAGYARTQSAANRLIAQIAERRGAAPASQRKVIEVPGLHTGPRIPDRLRTPSAPTPEPTGRIVATAHVESPARPSTVADAPSGVTEASAVVAPVPLPP